MQGQWNHGRAFHHCKFPANYPDPESIVPLQHLRQEEAVTPGLDRWLAQPFDDDHIDQTCNTLAGISEPDPAAIERDKRLTAGITEAQRECEGLGAQLGENIPGEQLRSSQVKALVTGLATSSLPSQPPSRRTGLLHGLVTSDLWCREVLLEGCSPCPGPTPKSSVRT